MHIRSSSAASSITPQERDRKKSPIPLATYMHLSRPAGNVSKSQRWLSPQSSQMIIHNRTVQRISLKSHSQWAQIWVSPFVLESGAFQMKQKRLLQSVASAPEETFNCCPPIRGPRTELPTLGEGNYLRQRLRHGFTFDSIYSAKLIRKQSAS